MTHLASPRTPSLLLFAVIALAGIGWWSVAADHHAGAAHTAVKDDALTIVWTSGDPDVAHRMVLMYAGAAKRQEWFADVRIIIWGPSQRLVVADKDIRAKIVALMEGGAVVEACQACSDLYGITEDLRATGMTVKFMGAPLSDDLKSGRHVITF